MKKKWKDYNKELVRRGEILIDPDILDIQLQPQQTKKLGRPFKYPRILILFILFLKYAFRLPYRQTEGFVKTLFREMGISIDLPNFRTIHYRRSRENFVIVFDSTGIKLTNRGEWLSKRHGKKNDSECAIGLIETARRKAQALACKVKEV